MGEVLEILLKVLAVVLRVALATLKAWWCWHAAFGIGY
jgi:hypothetical protein